MFLKLNALQSFQTNLGGLILLEVTELLEKQSKFLKTLPLLSLVKCLTWLGGLTCSWRGAFVTMRTPGFANTAATKLFA